MGCMIRRFCGVGVRGSPGRPSIADGEAALYETRKLHFVEKSDGRVLGGYATAPLGVHDGLVAADAEPAGAFARGDFHGRTEVGPEPVGGAIDVQRVAVATHRRRVFPWQAQAVDRGMEKLVGV